MAIHDIYSKRLKKAEGDVPDVYTYDDLPHPLRVQIVQIWEECYGSRIEPVRQVVELLRHEYGFRLLPSNNCFAGMSHQDELINFFLEEKDINKALDAVEQSFKFIANNAFFKKYKPHLVEELNYRFNEHGVGYKFNSLQIIKINSEFVQAGYLCATQLAQVARIQATWQSDRRYTIQRRD